MPRSTHRSISLPLSINRFRAKDGDIPRLRCQRCTIPLQIHQPDLETPDRLLGTCPGCHQWCFIESHSEQGWAAIALLPAEGLAPDLSEEAVAEKHRGGIDVAPQPLDGIGRWGPDESSGLPSEAARLN
jgi:hypothetical protein